MLLKWQKIQNILCLVDQASSEFERTGSNFESSSRQAKHYQTILHRTPAWSEDPIGVTNLIILETATATHSVVTTLYQWAAIKIQATQAIIKKH